MALAQITPLSPNAMFLLENHGLGLAGATVTANSLQPTGNLTADQLLSPSLDTAWRSGSLSDTVAMAAIGNVVRVRFTLGSPRTVDTVALGAGNVRTPWSISLYNNDPVTTPAIFTSPETNPIIRGRMGDFDWTPMPWTLGPSTERLDLWAAEFRLRSIIQADKSYAGITHVDVLLNATDASLTAQADYYQLGTVYIAQAFAPKINVLNGWNIGVNDLSETHRTDAGGMFGRKRARLRTFPFMMQYLSRIEAFHVVLDYTMEEGKLGIIFAWVEPNEPAFFYQHSMFGTATNLPDAVMANAAPRVGRAVQGWRITETE